MSGLKNWRRSETVKREVSVLGRRVEGGRTRKENRLYLGNMIPINPKKILEALERFDRFCKPLLDIGIS